MDQRLQRWAQIQLNQKNWKLNVEMKPSLKPSLTKKWGCSKPAHRIRNSGFLNIPQHISQLALTRAILLAIKAGHAVHLRLCPFFERVHVVGVKSQIAQMQKVASLENKCSFKDCKPVSKSGDQSHRLSSTSDAFTPLYTLNCWPLFVMSLRT